jgi:hypothetical protein
LCDFGKNKKPDLRHGIWRKPPPEYVEPNQTIEFGSESDGVMIGK